MVILKFSPIPAKTGMIKERTKKEFLVTLVTNSSNIKYSGSLESLIPIKHIMINSMVTILFTRAPLNLEDRLFFFSTRTSVITLPPLL